MTWWLWLLIGFAGGLAVIGIPVAVWYFRALKDWDRAWGFR